MHAVAGGLAGIFSGTAICPAEVVKCKLQYQRSGCTYAACVCGSGLDSHCRVEQTAATEGKQSSARYSSALDCAVKTVRQDGWRALFKGLGPILLRDVPFNFIFFGEIFYKHEKARSALHLACAASTGTYESMHAGMAWLDSWRHPADQDSASLEQATGTVVKDSPVRIFLAGGTAGATGWAIMFPLDVIKSSLQSGSMVTSCSPCGYTHCTFVVGANSTFVGAHRMVLVQAPQHCVVWQRGCTPKVVFASFMVDGLQLCYAPSLPTQQCFWGTSWASKCLGDWMRIELLFNTNKVTPEKNASCHL